MKTQIFYYCSFLDKTDWIFYKHPLYLKKGDTIKIHNGLHTVIDVLFDMNDEIIIFNTKPKK